MVELQKLLTEQEVASLTGISKPTLRRWRRLGSGPPFLRLGGLVRYDPAELRRWLKASRCLNPLLIGARGRQ